MKINGSIDPRSSSFILLVTLQWQNQYPSEISDITVVPVNSDIPELCARGTKIYYQLRYFSTCIDFPEDACEFSFICGCTTDLCFGKPQFRLANISGFGRAWACVNVKQKKKKPMKVVCVFLKWVVCLIS